MKDIDPRKELLKFCDQFETVTAAANALSLSKQYMGDMLQGRRDISPNVLSKLGLKRRVLVEREKTT